ncbi:MAG: tRNA pseudouridine(55) synthase TruB [Legionellales bacterium]|nr:tRNA pseudouridine(55) synthase TruB [Legionellales bacterium]
MPFDCHLILLNKPTDITSSQVAGRVKKLLNLKKIGHTGTLDPMATGMLPLCLNQATRYSQYLISKTKNYTATGIFGNKTDTGDSSGSVIKTSTHRPSPRDLEQAVDNLIGLSEQIPPMYSARHYQGKRLYQLARAGLVVPRESRPIQISQIQLDWYKPPSFQISLTCSSGTYVRTLIEDIADRVNTVATMTHLHRNWVEPLASYPMVELNDINDLSADSEHYIAIDQVIQIPTVIISETEATDLKAGKIATYQHNFSEPQECKAYQQDAFLGIVTAYDSMYLKAKRLRPTQ